MKNKIILFFYLFIFKLFLKKNNKKLKWLNYKEFGIVDIKSINKINYIKYFDHTRLTKFNLYLLKKIYMHSIKINDDIIEERKPSSNIYEMN